MGAGPRGWVGPGGGRVPTRRAAVGGGWEERGSAAATGGGGGETGGGAARGRAGGAVARHLAPPDWLRAGLPPPPLSQSPSSHPWTQDPSEARQPLLEVLGHRCPATDRRAGTRPTRPTRPLPAFGPGEHHWAQTCPRPGRRVVWVPGRPPPAGVASSAAARGGAGLATPPGSRDPLSRNPDRPEAEGSKIVGPGPHPTAGCGGRGVASLGPPR